MLLVTVVFHLPTWVLREAILSSSGLCGLRIALLLEKEYIITSFVPR